MKSGHGHLPAGSTPCRPAHVLDSVNSGHLPAGSTPAVLGGPGTAAQGPCSWLRCFCWPLAPLAAWTPSVSGPARHHHILGCLPAADAAAACSKESCLGDVTCRVDSSHVCKRRWQCLHGSWCGCWSSVPPVSGVLTSRSASGGACQQLLLHLLWWAVTCIIPAAGAP